MVGGVVGGLEGGDHQIVDGQHHKKVSTMNNISRTPSQKALFRFDLIAGCPPFRKVFLLEHGDRHHDHQEYRAHGAGVAVKALGKKPFFIISDTMDSVLPLGPPLVSA